LPEGLRVAPGKYKLVLGTEKYKDSVWVEVKTTHQEAYNLQAANKRMELHARLKVTTERAFKAFEALKEAEKSIEMTTGARYADDSAAARIKKLSGPLKDSVSKLKDLFIIRQDFRGYEDVSVRLNDRLGAAAGYIESNEYPGKNAEVSLQNAESETDRILKRVNRFFDNSWKPFRESVEKEKIKLFKDLGGY
jgi:hypothetical protein